MPGRSEHIPFSDMVFVNPRTDTGGLGPNELVSFIPMADVSDSGEWTTRQARPLKDVSTGYTPFMEGDVLFAKITPCMENGKGAHAVGLVNGRGFGSTEFHVLRPKPGYDGRFIFHWTQSRLLRTRAEAFMTGSAGQQRVESKFFKYFRVARMSIEQQRRIAEILDTIDEAIRRTERIIGKLKQVKQGLVHDLLSRGINENGQLRDPQRNPESFQHSPWGPIPRSWEIRSIKSLSIYVGSGLTPRGGSRVYTPTGVLFIRSQNVTFEGLVLNDVAYIDCATHRAMRRSEVFAYDVLINITGASIGRCCWIPPDLGPANVNQHVCTIRLPNATIDDAVVLSTILGSHIGQTQVRQLNAGSNREGLNYQQLRSFIVPWPPPAERTRLRKAIVQYEFQINSERGYLEKLRQLKQGLVDDLLTGKVRIPVPDETTL